jgi:hypothetical protein
MLSAIIMVLDLIELNSNTSNEIRIEFQCNSTIELKLLNSFQIQSKKKECKLVKKILKIYSSM